MRICHFAKWRVDGNAREVVRTSTVNSEERGLFQRRTDIKGLTNFAALGFHLIKTEVYFTLMINKRQLILRGAKEKTKR